MACRLVGAKPLSEPMLVSIGHLGTNFSEILSEIHTFSFKKIHLKMSSGKCRPFCLGLNVLTNWESFTKFGKCWLSRWDLLSLFIKWVIHCHQYCRMNIQEMACNYSAQAITWSTGRARTPSFWDTPTAPWLPILVIHIRSQVKTRQSQSYKFLKIAKNSNVEILQETIHATHLLKLLDKMYKYEMDPTRTVGATERTWDAGRTDGRTDRRTDKVKPIYPPTTSLCRGYNNGHGQ